MQGADADARAFQNAHSSRKCVGKVTTDLRLLPALAAPRIPILVDTTENGQQGT